MHNKTIKLARIKMHRSGPCNAFGLDTYLRTLRKNKENISNHRRDITILYNNINIV